MKLKDLKNRLNDAVETENPPGTGYYGSEVEEEDVETARERMDEATRMHEESADNLPSTRRQEP